MFEYTMDYEVLAYLVLISVGTGLLFGLAPASRLSKADINATLKDGSCGATGGRRSKRLSELLLGAEVTLAIVLLAGAGVMVRSFLLADVPSVDERNRPTVSVQVVGESYFETLGAPIISGRDFNNIDGVTGMAPAIVNQRLAASFWPGEPDLVGKRLRLYDGDIRRLVFRQGMLPVVVGLGAGVLGSAGVNRILQSSLVGISPLDPGTYVVTCALLAVFAALGCWIPAQRATRVDPIRTLKHD